MYDEDVAVLYFTAEDRCDGCAAQAYVKAEHPDADSELLFCAHHTKRFRNKLLADGWRLSYDTEALQDLYEPANV